jgi:hypothetical protein
MNEAELINAQDRLEAAWQKYRELGGNAQLEGFSVDDEHYKKIESACNELRAAEDAMYDLLIQQGEI